MYMTGICRIQTWPINIREKTEEIRCMQIRCMQIICIETRCMETRCI